MPLAPVGCKQSQYGAKKLQGMWQRIKSLKSPSFKRPRDTGWLDADLLLDLQDYVKPHSYRGTRRLSSSHFTMMFCFFGRHCCILPLPQCVTFFLRSVEIAVCGPCALEECKKKPEKKTEIFSFFFSSQQNKRSESGSSVCRRHYREALEQKAQRSGFHRALGARKPLSLNGHEDQDG